MTAREASAWQGRRFLRDLGAGCYDPTMRRVHVQRERPTVSAMALLSGARNPSPNGHRTRGISGLPAAERGVDGGPAHPGRRLAAPLITVARLTAGLAVAMTLLAMPETQAAPPSGASKSQNNYYKYVDDDGRVHISNVRRGKGDWKLWKSFVGSGGEGARGAPIQRDPVALQGDRYHRYDSYIRGAALRYQLPEALVRAVIHTESNYYPYARSRVGAMGLMQLMPSTAEYLGVTDAWDPRQNIYGGAKFLRLLANRFNGDMVLVLAGYHAGAGAVQKYGGVPPYETTRAYVKAVLRRYYAYERQAQVVAGTRRRGPARNIAE